MQFNVLNEQIANNACKAILDRAERSKPFVVKIEAQKRSNPQNAYYWGVVLSTIAYNTGDDADSLHEHFKSKYLKIGEVEVLGGAKVIKTKSSAKLPRDEFFNYIEQIRAEVAPFGIYIPDPVSPL